MCSTFDSVLRHRLYLVIFFFLMIRRPPRSTLDRSSAASDVYKRQACAVRATSMPGTPTCAGWRSRAGGSCRRFHGTAAVSYTHLRAHETVLDLVCRLLLEKKKKKHDDVSVMRLLRSIRDLSVLRTLGPILTTQLL